MTAFHKISYPGIWALGDTYEQALARIEDHAEVDSSIWLGNMEFAPLAWDRLALRHLVLMHFVGTGCFR